MRPLCGATARPPGLHLGRICCFALRTRAESTSRSDLHERGSGASVSACQGSSSRAVNTQVRRWEEDAEYELESEMSEVESSEEKRLAFACLSGAIEEVRAATSAPLKPALTRP